MAKKTAKEIKLEQKAKMDAAWRAQYAASLKVGVQPVNQVKSVDSLYCPQNLENQEGTVEFKEKEANRKRREERD